MNHPQGSALTLLAFALFATVTATASAKANPPADKIVLPPAEKGRRELSHGEISPDGKRLVVHHRTYIDSEMQDRISVIDVASGKVQPSLTATEPGENGFVSGVTFSPDGKWVAQTVVFEGTGRRPAPELRVRSAESGKVSYRCRNEDGSLHPLAFLPDSKRILHGSNDGPGHAFALELVDVSTGKLLKRDVPANREVEAFGMVQDVRSSPDGEFLLFVQDERASVWDIGAGRFAMNVRGNPNAPFTLATFLAGQQQVRTVSADGTVTTFDLASGRELARRHLEVRRIPLWSASFWEGGRSLLVSRDGMIEVWDADAGAPLGTFRHGPGPTSFAYMSVSADGRVPINVSGSRESDLQVVTLPSREHLSKFEPGRQRQ